MKIGDPITHPSYGRATLLAVERRPNGVFARLQFRYGSHSVPASEFPEPESSRLRSLAGQTAPLPAAASAATAPLVRHGNFATARAAVHALKLGQVLEAQVERISVGTQAHEESFARAFEQAERRKPQLIMIEGAWGVGKTHLLTLLSAHAAKRQFAISTTILDGVSASIADPMGLLASITGAIRFPGEAVPMGVGTKLVEVKRRGMPELRSMGGPRIQQVMESVPEAALDDADIVALLEDYLGLSLAASQARTRLARLGHAAALPALKARSIDERGDRFAELLGDWAAFCRAGKAKGLLVVLDEVDVDYAWARFWSEAHQQRHDATLAAIGALKKRQVPLVVAFGSAPAGPGGDTSVDPVGDVINKLGKVDAHECAAALTDAQLRELGQRVFALYAEAYPSLASKLSQAQVQAITLALLKAYRRQLSPVPRRFVRSLLHCLDLVDLGQASASSLTS